MTLYTDISPTACAVLDARVADGSLPAGEVRCADVKAIDEAALAPFAHVHLFCGIGGSPLGLAWAGWPPEWSVVTGGFPCQDISSAGKGAGLDGARSGLFWEVVRVLGFKRPMAAFLENVGALSARGLDRVALALESVGYEVEAIRVGAWAVGSPQERERWWIVCVRRDFARAGMAGLHGDGRGTGRGVAGDEGRAGRGRRQPGAGGEGGGVGDDHGQRRIARPGHAAYEHEDAAPEERAQAAGDRGPLADLRSRGQRAIGLGGAGAVADLAGSGVELGGSALTRREGHDGAPAGRERLPLTSGDPRRWPHKRWCVIDEDGRERTIPTPQYDWEPPRLYPGSRTISAAWRLALMGYPLHWLDIDPGTLAGMVPPRCKAADRWWNKRGIEHTGNAQVPQCVAVIARGLMHGLAEGGAK